VLGLPPVTVVDLALVSAVVAVPPVEADRIVERLLDAHLVEEVAPGRLHLRDLTRLFAHEPAVGTALPYCANDQSWQVLLSHIQSCALVPFAVAQFWLSRTMPLFSTTSS
jgi:hypothetical protein